MEGECPSTCGGLVAVACDKGLVCVDDPTDDCDPENGGADCGGICVEETTTTAVACICTLQYDPYCCDGTVYSNLCGAGCDGFTADDCVEAVEGECPSTCGGLAAFACDKGLVCVDDPTDDCDPENGGADCGGICVEEATTTAAATTTAETTAATDVVDCICTECDKGLVCVDDPTDDCDPENGG
eukprot:492596_1